MMAGGPAPGLTVVGGLGSTTGIDLGEGGGERHLRRGSAPEPKGGGHGAEDSEPRPHAADAGCTRHVRRRAESRRRHFSGPKSKRGDWSF